MLTGENRIQNSDCSSRVKAETQRPSDANALISPTLSFLPDHGETSKIIGYTDMAYFPFFRFMSENSLMVKINAKPIRENTTTPVRNKT
jgi:hypothetical protein